MIPKFDFHIHTRYSDGSTEPIRMVEAATTRGLEAVAITDHGPELSVGIDPSKINQMIKDVRIIKRDSEIPVLIGIEANILGVNGEIDIDEDTLDELELVIGGVHHLTSSIEVPNILAGDYLKALRNAIKLREIDVIAHPFWYYEDLTKYISREDVMEFARLAAENKVAIELNTKYRLPSRDFIITCLREGVKLSLGTDSHNPGDVGKLNWQIKLLSDIGVDEEDFILRDFI